MENRPTLFSRSSLRIREKKEEVIRKRAKEIVSARTASTFADSHTTT